MRTSTLFALLLASAMTPLGASAVRGRGLTAPQGFTFICSNGNCPDGSYQDLCPLCAYLNVSPTSTPGPWTLQCICFDSNQELQAVSTLPNAQDATSISVSSTGQLIDSGAGAIQEVIKSHLSHMSTPPPTAATVYVTFKYNCYSGSCPAGPYQKFCPRCSSDGTTLSCLCFGNDGVMLFHPTIMEFYSQCPLAGGEPDIETEDDGTLVCPSGPATIITDNNLP